MHSSGQAAGMGLVAAGTWGGSDFAGGLGAKRASALLVVTPGHVLTLAAQLAVCGWMRLPIPGPARFLEGAIGGLEGSLALALFYHALAMGAMGVTAALTGLLTALVPVAYSLLNDGLPLPTGLAGLGMGCVAIWLIAHSPAESKGGAPGMALALGALSGGGFGLQLILLKLAAQGGQVLWALTSARMGGVLGLGIALLATARKLPTDRLTPNAGARFWSSPWFLGIAAGVLDTTGNVFYTQASRVGRLDVAALVSSLYPAGTILLAGLVLRERPSRRQTIGMALALASVVLLSL